MKSIMRLLLATAFVCAVAASPAATHSSYECQEKLAREFIEQGTAKGLDASCVEGVKRLPFVTSLPVLPTPK